MKRLQPSSPQSMKYSSYSHALFVFIISFFFLGPSCIPTGSGHGAYSYGSVSTIFGDLQHSDLLRWAEKKEAFIQSIDDETAPQEVRFVEPAYLPIPSKNISSPSAADSVLISETAHLYFRLFGQNQISSLLWTGIESGNPLTKEENYRWNSLKEQGLYSSENRQKMARSLISKGIRNVRIGLSNHEIDVNQEATWSEATNLLRDLSAAGLKLSLDLHHFGIEDRFRVQDSNGKTIGEKSYYLHPEWPAYFAKYSRQAIEKYHPYIQAVTIMNEPETVVGFNGEFWHGGFPGWQHPQSNRFYIERAIQVAKASVLTRIEIENFLLQIPTDSRPQILFMHTEASVYKLYWEDFNLYRRFIPSDLILGHQWLHDANLEDLKRWPMSEIVGRWHRLEPSQRTNFDWVIENYIVYNQPPEFREERRQKLIELLLDLQIAHRNLASLGKSMRSQTVFAVDYYSHNEDRDADMKPLSPEPQYYATQLKAGRRVGLYSILVDYYNRYQMPIMLGETGTPYHHYGSRWHQQMLLECAKAAREGIPLLGLTIYPAIDTFGWEHALSQPKPGSLLNPSGITDFSYQPRLFMDHLSTSLRQSMTP